MTPENFILVLLEIAGGEIQGKTLIQKQAYFISEFLGIYLGYKAHFYGPYSQKIEDALNYNTYLNLIDEYCTVWGADPYGFERKKYEYKLNAAGREIVDGIKEKERDLYNSVKEIFEKLINSGVNDDYIAISIAAKVHYILTNSNDDDFTNEKIIAIARSFGWNISEPSIISAIKILQTVVS
ncbi:MAG: hypothetical protein V1720_06515 [bacterium]